MKRHQEIGTLTFMRNFERSNMTITVRVYSDDKQYIGGYVVRGPSDRAPRLILLDTRPLASIVFTPLPFVTVHVEDRRLQDRSILTHEELAPHLTHWGGHHDVFRKPSRCICILNPRVLPPSSESTTAALTIFQVRSWEFFREPTLILT